ncbi:MAG: CBS domain-containing protein [Holosporales bacterium]|jgi:CBS domain containing-hemolysin-like protein|nr:CBS domain-containing protein [Holosporales bacterium]
MSKSFDPVEKKSIRQRVSGFFKKLWRITSPKEQDTSIRDAIEELIEEDDEDGGQSINDDEKTILGNVLSLKELTAEDLMIPYANIVALPITATPDEVLATFFRANVSQIPIYSETVDNIVGLLCLKDIIPWLQTHSNDCCLKPQFSRGLHHCQELPLEPKRAQEKVAFSAANAPHLVAVQDNTANMAVAQQQSVAPVQPSLQNVQNSMKSILREILYVAPTMRVLDLLLQMRENGGRLAVVVDEFGGVSGIVTFALLIENIVGKIQYEESSGAQQIEVQPNGVIVLNAGTSLEELDDTLNDLYGLRINWLQDLNVEDVDTIGGLVTLIAEHVPIRGELIVHPLGFEFEILDADPRRVKKLAIRNVTAFPPIP